MAGLAAASKISRPLVAREDAYEFQAYCAYDDSKPGESHCSGTATSANAMKAQRVWWLVADGDVARCPWRECWMWKIAIVLRLKRSFRYRLHMHVSTLAASVLSLSRLNGCCMRADGVSRPFADRDRVVLARCSYAYAQRDHVCNFSETIMSLTETCQ